MLIMAVAAYGLIAWGLRLGVDFRGGSVMEIEFQKTRPDADQVLTTFNRVQNVKNVSINSAGDLGYIVRLDSIDENTHAQIKTSLNDQFGTVSESRFDSVGPTIGSELKYKSIEAVIVLIICIAIYIAIMFRTLARAVSPWAMSGATMFALLHDVVITVGFFAFLGHFADVEISAVFVAAVLTILGYSISDSVIVFDRVRENVIKSGFKEKFSDTVHKSIIQTLTRSINSSMTTLLALTAVYLFGGDSVKYFALALIVGIFLGTYSSIFVASPILMWARETFQKNRA